MKIKTNKTTFLEIIFQCNFKTQDELLNISNFSSLDILDLEIQ